MSFLRQIKFGFGKHLPVVLQSESSECALACIVMIMNYHGNGIDIAELRKQFLVSLTGATLASMSEFVARAGMTSRSLRLDLEELGHLQTPAILHWDLNHFVVLKGVHGKSVHIHDPAYGALKLSVTEVSQRFTGVALELAPNLQFKRQAAKPPIELRTLIGRVVGLKRGLIQLLGLAVVLEAIALGMPLVSQLITDEAILGRNTNLLSLLAFGLVGLGISSAVIGAVRSWIGIYISTNFNLQWMSNIMGRLLKLPVEYFERRHVGDIVSRFGAVRTIEHGITSATIEALLDGMLAIGTLAMMLLYSPSLAGVTLSAVTIYGLLRWWRYGAERVATIGTIAKEAKEQTYFLETVRGARSIKMCNRENERRAAWINLSVDSVNARLVTQRLALVFGTSRSFIETIERALVFWLGGKAVMNGQMSLGMLFAFISYKEQFSSRVNTLIGRVVDFRMLGVSVERLADIVLTAPEEMALQHRPEIPDDLTLRFENVDFRYSQDDRYILREMRLTVRPGECIAVIGPSGCGKTTCLKILLGILRPAKGKITLGGLSIEQLGLRNFRSVIATVMQDDQLFAGTIFDNIAFLDPKPDREWAQQCAEAACIHDEIRAMPMGYYTLVGDMGSVLSGGQKQRILLARALYRRPNILALDEATSHLDLNNEAKIAQAIASLNITRIMIAHRPQTIAIADRVLRLDNGILVDVSGELSTRKLHKPVVAASD